MRCFKIFFKHTWHPHQMENRGTLGSSPRQLYPENETELGEVKAITEIVPVTSPLHGIPCRDGACKISNLKPRAEQRLDSPWHYLKTVFLVSMIVALIIWIVVYVLLSQYEVL